MGPKPVKPQHIEDYGEEWRSPWVLVVCGLLAVGVLIALFVWMLP